MRPWPIELLRLSIAPDACHLRRGSREVLATLVAPTTGVITASDLAAWLAAVPGKGQRLAVSVADSWVRYQILTWPAGLRRAAEREAYVRLRLRDTYGGDIANWPVAMAGQGRGVQLTAALDPAIRQAVTTWASNRTHVLTALQPAWVAALEQWRGRLQAPVGAFARLAGGRLTAGIWDDSGWLAVRSLTAAGSVPVGELQRWLGLHAEAGRCFGLGWHPGSDWQDASPWRFDALEGRQ